MKAFRGLSLSIVALVVSVPIAAQQAPQRDPQAVALLTQAYLNMGGARRVGIVDIRATGRVFSPNDIANPVGTFEARLRGKDFSMETTLNGSQFRYRVLNGRGSASRNGQVKPLPPYNTMGLGLDILPLFARWTEFAQGAAAVAAPTTTQVGGFATYSIRVDLGDSGTLNDHGRIEVLIDRASGLVVAMRYQATLGPYVNYKTAVENRFANYKDFGGILLPTQVTRYINGQPRLVFEINQVQANNGFTDIAFRN
jgi:hypothetical protein